VEPTAALPLPQKHLPPVVRDTEPALRKKASVSVALRVVTLVLLLEVTLAAVPVLALAVPLTVPPTLPLVALLMVT
jgi:hypothetical protein